MRLADWRYSDTDSSRDLRFDFLRGAVMLVMIVVHIEVFSLFDFIAWERAGVVSGAEGFVILSGVVVGMVYGRKIAQIPFGESALKVLARAAQLYRVNLAIIGSILLLRYLPGFDTTQVATFTDRVSGRAYPLFPFAGMRTEDFVTQVVYLRVGPHQTQVLGLYVYLMVLAVPALYLMARGRTALLLVASWATYALQALLPTRPTTAQFEFAFPLLTWQLLFMHGLAVGFHRDALAAFSKRPAAKWLIGAAIAITLALAFFAQNTPNVLIPSYARLHLIPAATYRRIYRAFCQKSTLGLLRILDDAALLTVAYTTLTVFWKPLKRAFGWYFIPIGQSSLYAFIMHLYIALLASNVVQFGFDANSSPPLLRNTLVHAAALATAWLLVRYRVLYRWIPR